MSAVIYPDDYKVMKDILNEQLTQGNTIHNENRLICKDGSIKWISIKAQLFIEGDEPCFYCVFVDIPMKRKYSPELEIFMKKNWLISLSCLR